MVTFNLFNSKIRYKHSVMYDSLTFLILLGISLMLFGWTIFSVFYLGVDVFEDHGCSGLLSELEKFESAQNMDYFFATYEEVCYDDDNEILVIENNEQLLSQIHTCFEYSEITREQLFYVIGLKSYSFTCTSFKLSEGDDLPVIDYFPRNLDRNQYVLENLLLKKDQEYYIIYSEMEGGKMKFEIVERTS